MAGQVKHLHYLTGSHSLDCRSSSGWLREDRSVCWRVTKEVNWRLPVRVQSTHCTGDDSALLSLDYVFVGFLLQTRGATSGCGSRLVASLLRRRSQTIRRVCSLSSARARIRLIAALDCARCADRAWMAAYLSSIATIRRLLARKRARSSDGQRVRRGSDSAAECVSRLDYSRIHVRL